MAHHRLFTAATGCRMFFADPHSPWQRGTNENMNGLLRQYYPRAHTNFREVPQDALDLVADELNTRPRKILNWHTPWHILATGVATAA